MLDQVQNAANAVNQRTFETIDTYYPPAKRNDHYNQVQAWVHENPRLAAFVALQLVFSGGPVLFFSVFALSVFVGAIVTALTLAITFTAFVIGIASLILLPVLFLTTAFATGSFIFGYIVYAISTKFATDPRTEPFRRKTQEYTQAALLKSQEATQKAAAQTQAAALSAAGAANQLSNGRLEQALGDSKQALEQQRANDAIQVPATISATANGDALPANATASSLEVDPVTVAPVRQLSVEQKVAEARAGSRPALF